MIKALTLTKYASLLLASALFTNYAWAANTPSESSAVIKQAQSLANTGNHQAAYDLLKKHEIQLAGDTEYDYLLGKTALDIDQPTMAIFAFERCLAINPQNQQCQFGMAKSHISLKESAAARSLISQSKFDTQSDQYKDLMTDLRRILLNQDDTNQDTRFNLWIQAGLGYDSNANTATTTGSIFLPDYGNMILRRDFQRKESFFNQTMLGINYSTAINDKWRFVADGLVRHKNNWRVHDYDSFITDARLGFIRNHNGHRFSIRATGQYYNLGGHSYRNIFGALGQYSYSLSPATEIGGFAQYSKINYPHANYRNAHRTVGGLTWSHQINTGKTILYGSFYGGREAAIDSDYRHLSYDLAGLQLGTNWLITPRLRLDLNTTYQHRNYDKQEPLFKKHRKDNQIGARLGLVYSINRKLTLRPSYEYTHTHSSIELRHYSRHVVSFNVRYAIF